MPPSHNAICAQVFCDTGESWSEEMRQACFDYLRLGGIYAQGPISLLSGLNPRPFILVAHFFMVALYGVRPIVAAGPLARAHARARRLAVCSSRCPRRARFSWACACCWAPALSSCPSSARRACAPCSSRRWCVGRARGCVREKHFVATVLHSREPVALFVTKHTEWCAMSVSHPPSGERGEHDR